MALAGGAAGVAAGEHRSISLGASVSRRGGGPAVVGGRQPIGHRRLVCVLIGQLAKGHVDRRSLSAGSAHRHVLGSVAVHKAVANGVLLVYPDQQRSALQAARGGVDVSGRHGEVVPDRPLRLGAHHDGVQAQNSQPALPRVPGGLLRRQSAGDSGVGVVRLYDGCHILSGGEPRRPALPPHRRRARRPPPARASSSSSSSSHQDAELRSRRLGLSGHPRPFVSAPRWEWLFYGS
mmetsp:Transcript_25420/g.48009  ORF Transcript_25420/g.48009 Transcript_25420/m.48009 type:complete len:235 (+) Transcript_25420:1647-2351(+)